MRGAGAEQISVLVRSMVESKAGKNVLRLFSALGYKLDHELLRVGFTFHFQRGAQITVSVSSVNKMLKLRATDEAVPVTPGIQLVEVTAPATPENYTEVSAAISSFCEYLAPLLHLSRPGVSTGVVPTAAAAAASLMSDGGGHNLVIGFVKLHNVKQYFCRNDEVDDSSHFPYFLWISKMLCDCYS
ncbi:hypothetical protein REPUB_Repub09cG0132800 [Reevesia pubescens]